MLGMLAYCGTISINVNQKSMLGQNMASHLFRIKGTGTMTVATQPSSVEAQRGFSP